MRSPIRKAINVLSYGVYLIAAVLVMIYVVFWTPFVDDLETRRAPKDERHKAVTHISSAVLNRLGSLGTEKKSSFVNFSKVKEPGIRRVCAFGDSYTYGYEVAEDDDFPTILQDLFERRGYTHIQVLNFGNIWYGFHQAYLIWDLVGSHFDCDYVILGPESFQPNRDTRFNHTNMKEPYYLHSRFVLEDGGLRLIDVVGDTHEERFSNYFSFFPRWEYLRYDRNPPAIVQSMLIEGRTISNPFYYYRGSEEEEALKTYGLLLRRLAERAPNIVLAHDRSEIIELGKSLEIDNLVVAATLRQRRFPYWAPDAHNSAMGNRIVAEQFFTHLVAGTGGQLTVLASFDTDPETAMIGMTTAPALSTFKRIEVRIGDQPVGRFTSTRQRKDYRHFQDDEIDALIAIRSPDTPLVDAFFFPLGRAIDRDAPLILRVVREGETETHVLGRIRWLDPRVRIGSVAVQGLRYKRGYYENNLYFGGNDTVPLDALPAGGARFELSIGGEQLIQGNRRKNVIKFDQGDAEIYILRSAEGQGVDVDTLGSRGTYDLVLIDERDGEQRVPFGAWEKRSATVPTPNHAITDPIVRP